MIKQRKESVKIYSEAGRDDLKKEKKKKRNYKLISSASNYI